MTENTVTSKDVERQEAVKNAVGAALDTLYGCRSNIEVFIQLFRLKNHEEEGNVNNYNGDDFKNHAFFEGLEWIAQALHGKVNEAIELLYDAE